MITVLIEENYAKNSRVGLILDGILSVTRRKRVAVEVYTDEKKIKSKPRVVVLICASLKWATETIEKFNGLGIHPLLFGFQYIDTVFRYSSITLNYTQNTYLLTRYLLDKDAGETVFLGANKDSMTDRQKYIGMEKPAGGFGYFRRCFPALWLGSRIRRALRLRSGETVRPGRPGERDR